MVSFINDRLEMYNTINFIINTINEMIKNWNLARTKLNGVELAVF